MASTVDVQGHASSWFRRWVLAALITHGDLQIWVVEKKVYRHNSICCVWQKHQAVKFNSQFQVVCNLVLHFG